MPDDVYQVPVDLALMSRNEERPSYQRNDYSGWIGRAKQPVTRQKRIDYMLAELDEGGFYMKIGSSSVGAELKQGFSSGCDPNHLAIYVPACSRVSSSASCQRTFQSSSSEKTR